MKKIFYGVVSISLICGSLFLINESNSELKGCSDEQQSKKPKCIGNAKMPTKVVVEADRASSEVISEKEVEVKLPFVGLDKFFITEKSTETAKNSGLKRKYIGFPLGRELLLKDDYSYIIHPDGHSILSFLNENGGNYGYHEQEISYSLEIIYEKSEELSFLESFDEIDIKDISDLISRGKFSIANPVKTVSSRALLREISVNEGLSIDIINSYAGSEYEIVSNFGNDNEMEFTVSLSPYINYYQDQGILTENAGRLKISGMSIPASMPIIVNKNNDVNENFILNKSKEWSEMGLVLSDRNNVSYDESKLELLIHQLSRRFKSPKNTTFVLSGFDSVEKSKFLKKSIISSLNEPANKYPWNTFGNGDVISIYDEKTDRLESFDYGKRREFERSLLQWNIDKIDSYGFLVNLANDSKDFHDEDYKRDIIIISDEEISDNHDFANNIERTRTILSDYNIKQSPIISMITVGDISDMHANSLSGISGGFSAKIKPDEDRLKSALMHAYHVKVD